VFASYEARGVELSQPRLVLVQTLSEPVRVNAGHVNSGIHPGTKNSSNHNGHEGSTKEHEGDLRGLVQGVDGKAAEEFGVEVGGLLGKHFSGEGDVANLGDAARIHEEGEVRVTGAHRGEGFGDVAHVG
jgi:hypothetical protein